MGYLIGFVEAIFNIIMLAILARVLLTWFPATRYSSLYRIIYELTEPILSPLRRVIPPIGMVDLSPLVAIILLEVLARFISGMLGRF